MVEKNILVGLIILALVIVGLVGYYVILPGIIQRYSSGESQTFSGGITEAHFEIFPAGTQLEPGMIGTNTSIFNKDDLVSISGESDVSKQVVLTIKIFDNNGNDMGTAWYGNEIKIQTGPFGFGSITIPQTAGTYLLKIYLDNSQAKALPFQVL